MVIDTSVVVAILKPEPDGEAFVDRLAGKTDLELPASCYLEAAMVLSTSPNGRARLDGFLQRYGVAIVPCDERQARLAADAFERFGRGTGHAAKLNFGDCLAYAAAAASGAPLLFKGRDFTRTDIVPAA